MAYDRSYDYPIEDMGEFARAEFGGNACFSIAYDKAGHDRAVVESVELYEWVSMPTLGADGIVRSRFVKEPRECPSWFVALIERKYQDDMLAVYYRDEDDRRYYRDDLAAERADTLRDELIDRELRGAM